MEARHVDVANGRWVFPAEEAKGKRRARVVYLSDDSLKTTIRLMDEHPTGKLFRTTAGRPWRPFSVNCRFRRLHEKTGIKTCLYVFRQSFATRLLESGVYTGE